MLTEWSRLCSFCYVPIKLLHHLCMHFLFNWALRPLYHDPFPLVEGARHSCVVENIFIQCMVKKRIFMLTNLLHSSFSNVDQRHWSKLYSTIIAVNICNRIRSYSWVCTGGNILSSLHLPILARDIAQSNMGLSAALIFATAFERAISKIHIYSSANWSVCWWTAIFSWNVLQLVHQRYWQMFSLLPN